MHQVVFFFYIYILSDKRNEERKYRVAFVDPARITDDGLIVKRLFSFVFLLKDDFTLLMYDHACNFYLIYFSVL
jgi:hypothetical protein